MFQPFQSTRADRSRGLLRLGARALGAGLFASIFLVESTAAACGGFFCSASNPVNQAAERIIFSKNDDGTVTTIVEIMYEGPAEQFAWILPVPGVPEVALSSKLAFDRLQSVTNPQYSLTTTFPDDCNVGFPGSTASGGSGGSAGLDSGGGPVVVVLDSGTVGALEYETISVDAADEDPADVAIEWLELNEYDVGSLGPGVLRPYLSAGMNLIAFKLQKGASTGSIRPVSLTYESARPAIPIRPTAVAANDDMGVMVWVLGDHRAIPENYRALELNELLIDWFNPNSTYNEVVSRAADEAGGQGFVTEFAGAAASYEEIVAPSWERQSITEYSGGNYTVAQAIEGLTATFGQHDGFLDAMNAHVTLREGLTSEDFVTCTYCYFYPEEALFTGIDYGTYDPETDPIAGTDLDAFIAAIEDEVLGPIEDTAELFATHPYLTRLYTTMSASEMTRDPEFDFNADAEDVSNVHQGTRVVSCDGSQWRATLPDGYVVYGEGTTWPISALDPNDLPFNRRVLQYGTSGDPDIITDNSGSLITSFLGTPWARPNEAFPDDPDGANPTGGDASESSGGCSVGPGRGFDATWLLVPLALAGLGFGRRRRALGPS